MERNANQNPVVCYRMKRFFIIHVGRGYTCLEFTGETSQISEGFGLGGPTIRIVWLTHLLQARRFLVLELVLVSHGLVHCLLGNPLHLLLSAQTKKPRVEQS